MSSSIALTIAGFDPTGGAGVLADARTFTAFGMEPFGVITSLTFQSPTSFFGAEHQSPDTIRRQLESLVGKSEIACAKTGMLPTREVVVEVARLFREFKLPAPVVDPVLISSSGFRLMDEDAIEVIVADLFPLAQLVTPNIPEAETLAGMSITSEADMRRAATIIRQMGARSVLIKGGHLDQEAGAGGITRRQEDGSESRLETGDSRLETNTEAIDVLDNGGTITVFRERRVPGAQLHGSGCVLSAAIAAGLGKGINLEESVRDAKRYVFEKLKQGTSAGSAR
ncbi:MAG TPA: hydroxymethylpyrimidine/phosphomethylpyrimidine kinase [Pyrinomonadaceae bacterium]|nr:hydroxymethylpyrimidine/phosphomethylpyrimidine kinase [Pyrinomonadaceae bacterium]